MSADLLASENLINCYLREGGFAETANATELRVPLKNLNKNLYVSFARRLKLGDVRLSEAVRLEGEPLHATELADLLSQEIGSGYEMPEGRTSDWRQNFLSSLEISDMILEERAEEGPLDFASSEQGLICGHRFHPSPKSRIGFDRAELAEYSPEFSTRIQLHYFAMPVAKNSVTGDADFLERWRLLCADMNLREDEIALPLHPWQAKCALQDEAFKKLLASGELRDLGIRGPLFTVTSSVRTLYQPEWDLFVKASLAVRLTNCYRLNLPWEMKAIRIINNLLESVNCLEGTRVRLLREPMGLDLSADTGVKLGTLFREGLGEDKDALLCAALFGDRHFGVERLRKLGVDHQNLHAWFALYCERLVPPLVDLFWKGGILVEPHLQNTLVVLRDGVPDRFVVRDLDNARVIAGSNLDPAVEAIPEMVYSPKKAWRRFTYCLVVNHLAEVAGTLSDLCLSSDREHCEGELWRTLRQTLVDCVIPEPFKHELLNGPYLFAKKNFFTRVTRCNDSDAPFAELPNPLAAVK